MINERSNKQSSLYKMLMNELGYQVQKNQFKRVYFVKQDF